MKLKPIFLSLFLMFFFTSKSFAIQNCENTGNWTTTVPSGCAATASCYDPGTSGCTGGLCGNIHDVYDPGTKSTIQECCTSAGCMTLAMGSSGSSDFEVDPANPPAPAPNPVISFKTPEDKYTFALGEDITISVDVTSMYAGITKVEFYKNRVLVGTVTPKAFLLTTTASQVLSADSLESGTYDIEVKAYDVDKKVGTSSVSFTVSK